MIAKPLKSNAIVKLAVSMVHSQFPDVILCRFQRVAVVRDFSDTHLSHSNHFSHLGLFGFDLTDGTHARYSRLGGSYIVQQASGSDGLEQKLLQRV